MFFNALYIALCEIRRNLMRAFLTVLGIIIGVAAVITMVTLGQGATSAVKNQISNLGSNLLVLRPGQGFGPRSSSAGVPNFSEKDAQAVEEQIGGLVSVAPTSSTNVSTIYLQNARSTEVTGTTPEYFSIGKWSLESGRFFERSDLVSGKAVCVIGGTVKKEMFGSEDPIGTKIRLGKSSCEVIGVLKTKGQSGQGRDQDDTIVVPLTTLQRRLVGKTSEHDISTILISAEDDADTTAIINEISLLMRERRNLQANEDDDFTVIDTRQIAEAVSSSTQVMTTLLGAVAGVSLLVGGIGIMNIMLVSVTERTREIGIRLAVGARAREVLLQFLVEAVTLACIGGLIGLALAFGLCVVLSKVIGVPFLFDMKINLIAFLFSGAVGVLFGFMPARRAAALDPIDALRHE
ncbi:ABC transporter permease [Verrucomicrobiaceae bacterium R5-34]|uniref:ABC transporter permease n=1 Tax=Oceaniferula flava TaxID=2800421 RepID=A0AAE2SDU3_9BACT|nr:ABC transporter permease [Verrucomicrobiaceae bacterium R5-34]MBK1856073.1 ABC transporter permease [Oceaniferula flavus]MBM1137380.1 ABC transporter permease [Oceaniferula flavus]